MRGIFTLLLNRCGLLLALVLLAGPAFAQTLAGQWGLQSVGPAPDRARVRAAGVSADGLGHVYVAGPLTPDPVIPQPVTRSLGSISLTTTGTNVSSFVAQASTAGQWQWVREIRPVAAITNPYVHATDVVATATGEIYVAGYLSAAAVQIGSFTQPLVDANHEYTFVARLNTAGVCQWLQVLDASFSGNNGPRIAWDAVSGNLTLASLTIGTVQVGGTVLPGTGSDPYLYLAQLSPAGQWLSLQAATGARVDEIDQMAFGHQGQLAISGLWRGGSLQFGSTTLIAPLGGSKSQCFLAEASAASQWQWALGGSPYAGSYFGGLAYTSAGELWSAGYGVTGTPIGPIMLTANAQPRYVGFVGRLSAGGQWVSAYQVSPQGSGSAFFGQAALDGAGNVVVLGIVASTTSGPTTASAGGFTITAGPGEFAFYLARLSPAGQWQYAQVLPQATGTNAQVSLDNSVLDRNGDFYLAGSLRGSLSFGSSSLVSQATYPGTDVLLLKVTQAGVLASRPPTARPTGLMLTPNPAHTQITVRLPTSKATLLVLLDALGRPVRTYALPARATTATLDLTGLTPGLYVVRYGSAAGRLVVE